MKKPLGEFTALSLSLLACGCALHETYTAPGIQHEEAVVLERSYYWKTFSSPTRFSDSEIEKVFRQSLDPTLDGERAELHTSQLVWALAAVGDKHFSELLAKQSLDVRHATLQAISSVWTHDRLHYPLTEGLASR
jgi:hypothetical protein